MLIHIVFMLLEDDEFQFMVSKPFESWTIWFSGQAENNINGQSGSQLLQIVADLVNSLSITRNALK